MSRRYNKREQRSVSNGDWFHHEKNRGMRQKPLWTAAEEACAKEHISKAEQQKIFFLVGVFAFKTDSGTYCHLHLNQWAIVELPSLSNQDKILPIIHQSFWLWPPTTFAPHAHIRYYCRRPLFKLLFWKRFDWKYPRFFEQTTLGWKKRISVHCGTWNCTLDFFSLSLKSNDEKIGRCDCAATVERICTRVFNWKLIFDNCQASINNWVTCETRPK